MVWDAEMVPVPRAARFPIELRPPFGFRPEDATTWPHVPGRIEYVGGRLLYMTPCGDVQSDVVGSVAGLLDDWIETHPDWTFGTNEAGMLLGGDVRGADAAVWRRDTLGEFTGRYRRVPPVLAVEVAGLDEGERELRDKAAWYLSHGVEVVWIVLPETREVLVVTGAQERRFVAGERLSAHPALPALEPDVDRFYRRLR